MSVDDNPEICAKLKAVQTFKRLFAFPFLKNKTSAVYAIAFSIISYCRANQEWQCRNIVLRIDK